MFMKKLVRGATTSFVSKSLRQKSKISFGKVKHLGNKADLSFKLSTSDPGWYENMDTFFNDKLGHKMGKNLGYGADSKSDRPLDSCTNTLKAKHFNSDMVKALSLGLCNFGSVIDNINMNLLPPVSLKFLFHLVAFVKKKLCFEPTKSFAVNIGLLAKLFYKIDGFGDASISLKFSGIIKMSFMSEFSLALVKQLVVFENLVEIIIKKIPVDLSKLVIESALVKYEKIFSIKIQLIGLWQKALNSAHVTKANTDKQTWDLRNSYCTLLYTLPMGMTAYNFLDLTAICSILVFKGVNLIWAGLFSPKYTVYGNFGHISSRCNSGEKNIEQSFKKRFLCSDSDKKHLVLIYAKKQAPVSCPVFFGGVTWTFVVSDFSKNLSSILFVETNSGIGSVDGSTSVVIILASYISVLKHLLENVFDQMADILHKLNRLLAVLLANFTVLPIFKHNPVLDMAVDTPLFVPSVLSVVTAISQNISPSGFQVLTVKVSGLEANLVVLENLIKATMNKLNSFGSDSSFPDVRVFTSGLDAKFLGVSITLIINKNLAKYVPKIFEILGRLLMTGFVNFFITRAHNESTFVILSGNFNKNGNKHSSNFSKCVDLNLVNTLVNSFYIKTSTWRNSKGVKKTIDYIFVSQSLNNALVNGQVVDVDEFFSTNYSFVQIMIGLSGILDSVLRAICKFNVKNADGVKWKWYRTASHDNFVMFFDEFADFHCSSNLDSMWSVVHKAICFSANFDDGFTKCFSYYHRLELLVSKLIKTSCSVSSDKFVSLLNIWVSLDSVNASIIKSFFFLGSHFDTIRSALAKIRKSYCSLKIMELKCAKNSQIRLVIDKRMENFELNKSQTIRSVLEQPFCKVILDHLVVNDDLILEPNLVKFHIDRIMEDWTRKCVYVFNNAFLNIIHSIEVDEFLGVKEVWVSMIPKPYDWEGVFMNIRLIALIKTAYKIFSKILSDRISIVYNKYDIFHGNNFLVLKSITIQFPIFAISLVVKDALEKNCELWLVLQDIRKVYDLVGWEHLKKSLVRIKIYSRFIIFFGSIHNNCINRVMTDFRLTDDFSVYDGLDQEEVFSPLLRHIFYDTLLCKVKRQETVCDYRLNLYYVAKTGHVDLQNGLISFLATGAFVDDTIWVGSNQAATQHILNVVSKFFRMNDILINNDKTVVILINCRVVALFLSVNNTPISITKKKPSLAKAHSDVWFFANFVLKKAISDKQFSYLVSAKSMKLKLSLFLNFSNNVLYYSSFYGLKTFEQIQAKGKIVVVVLSWCLVHFLCSSVCISVNPLNNFLADMVWVFLDSGLFSGNFISNAFRFWDKTPLSEILDRSMYFRCLPFFYYYRIAFFVTTVWHFYDSGFLDVSSSSPDVVAAKNILESYEFRSVHDWLFGIGASGFFVYTDSSFCSLESVDIKAGAAAFFEDINLGLRVEVSAIALALKCVLNSSSVHLFSDSQAALDVCKSELLLLVLDFWNKCWVECQHIAGIICERNLNVGWHKVKKHSGVLGRADFLACISSHLGWLLSPWLKKCFVLANGSIVSGNSRHFVCFGTKIVDSHLLTDIDWFKLSLVWHPNSHMAAGFTSRYSTGSYSYFMKALYYRLLIAVRKCFYDKHYPSIVCLYCDNVEVLDHVFSYVFDAAAWFQLFIDFAFAWRAISGLFHASSCVLQMRPFSALITLRLHLLLLPSEDNDRTIIFGLLFAGIIRVLIIVDIWYSTVVFGALETGGTSKADSVLEAVAAGIDKVTLDQTLANEITFSPYWKKKLTDLQVRIMVQWDLLRTSLLMGHCSNKSTGNGVQIYLSLGREM
ncbi:hypothetical protein G9A89_006697 [Geosiphon pyriformis]|nr:hypothetical protein G9A89_006697 [Geosiphon pyriformis]